VGTPGIDGRVILKLQNEVHTTQMAILLLLYAVYMRCGCEVSGMILMQA
jgi:hypothetical protein